MRLGFSNSFDCYIKLLFIEDEWLKPHERSRQLLRLILPDSTAAKLKVTNNAQLDGA